MLDTIKSLIKKFVPLKVLRRFKKSIYFLNRRKPFSFGYEEFREEFIDSILKDTYIMELFRSKRNLPNGYGFGLDERVVEYPWLISNLPKNIGITLDAGSACNFSYIIDELLARYADLTILTLAPELNCFWDRKISYNFGDIRNIPIIDAHYDSIISISTLGHIGMENDIYTSNARFHQKNPDDFKVALIELKRILRPKGKLYLTVVYGRYINGGWFQQFDKNMIDEILNTFAPTNYSLTFFKYTKDGWNIASQEECDECEYFDIHKTKYFDKLSTKGFDEDRAAAARSVACIVLEK